ncbi:hypothetical protein DSO57_1033673 [Entomophthora muscae]|uniref:Uncharacterized protein n=2 Tax=Entomophthora muscae TaxID=34485 RepID=A0ACC2TXW6_9FUNG|nr:hypothetical protein DSO57_1033673 [Entomophthora muscae]
MFSFETSSKLVNLLLFSQNKHLHYTVIRLLFLVVISTTEPQTIRPFFKFPLNAIYNVTLRQLNEIAPRDSTIATSIQGSSLSLQSCFQFYHLLYKYLRNNLEASFKKNAIINELSIGKIILSLQKIPMALLIQAPELENSMVCFLIDLLKDPSLLSSSKNYITDLCFKMLSVSYSENQFIIRKRLELASTLVKVYPEISSWDHVLSFLVDHVMVISSKLNNVDWTEFIESSQTTFISQMFEFDNKEYYDFESLRTGVLLAVSAVLRYFTAIHLSSWDEAKILNGLLHKLLYATDNRQAFSMYKQLHSLFFLFLPSQPCLYKLISYLLDIETLQQSQSFDIINQHRELTCRISELLSAHLLIIRFFKSREFNEDVVISCITEGDRDGINFFKKFIENLNTSHGWARFLGACQALPTNFFYDVGLMMFDILRVIQSKDSQGIYTLAKLNLHTQVFYDTLYCELYSVLHDVCLRFSVTKLTIVLPSNATKF